ncbi:hypothetical protein JTB14_000037 [Gonioctena quinquepunctata]|nr:hypothetical protein JTB14_000037 [Gonioctena quinquepunctata]
MTFGRASGEIPENYGELEISYLKMILEQKDVIISQQQDNIESLKSQIILMKQISIYSKTESGLPSTSEVPRIDINPTGQLKQSTNFSKGGAQHSPKNQDETVRRLQKSNVKQITAGQVAYAVADASASLSSRADPRVLAARVQIPDVPPLQRFFSYFD